MVALLLPREKGFVRSEGLARLGAADAAASEKSATCSPPTAIGFGVLFNFIAVFTYVSFHLAAPPYHFSSTLLGAIFVTYLVGTVIAPMTGWMMARLGRRRFILAVIAAWVGGAVLMLAPPVPAIIAGLTFCAGCGMLCQTISTGYVTEIAKEGRSSAVGLYVTSFYVGGSMGAFLPGLAWERGGWPACDRHGGCHARRHGGDCDARLSGRDGLGSTPDKAQRGKRMTAPSRSHFDFLQSIDTPTVCNLVEIVAPERRGFGYTVKHLHCPFPELPPIVGFAKTVTFKAKDAVPLGEAGYMQKRLDYLDYVAGSPRPSIMVMEDLDGEHVGYGAFWGEVQSNVHKALGCLGVVTNGSIRDIPMIAPGFQMLAGSIVPSHAYVHVVDFGIDVNVHGMAVKSGDLVHADRHGAVVVPTDKIDAMQAALDGLAAREAKIIAAAKAGGDVAAIKAAMKG